MKRQIRRGVWETNSSMTHVTTIMTVDDYEKYKTGDYYYFNGLISSYIFVKPKQNVLYSREEAIELLKQSKWFDRNREDDPDYIEDMLADDFENYDEEGDFYRDATEFTTPGGETIVVVCKYGHD